MEFAREDRGFQTPAKPTAGKKFSEGTEELKRRADQINKNPNVVAAKDATKKGIKKVGDTVAGIFGMGEEQQPLHGGKRRRKSRRKKRTKRRRKSRRKKRRTKRRRKSRRKRRR